MKKNFLLFLALTPAISFAGDAGCAKVGASMYLDLTAAIARDLHIDSALLQEKKTSVKVISILPVAEVFADQLAQADSEALSASKLRKEDYFESYYTNAAENITAQYTFSNGKGQRNIFIASSLMNNDECSVRFNGYLTLSREF